MTVLHWILSSSKNKSREKEVMENIKVGDRVATQVANIETQQFKYRLGTVVDTNKFKHGHVEALVLYEVRFDDGGECILTGCSLMRID